jgi:hypothetical protein
MEVPDSPFRPYAEAAFGLGFIDETDVTLVAPGANVSRTASDFYDQTTALTFGANVGVLVDVSSMTGVFVQGGFRRVSGMSPVDDLEGTGLETINDRSSRWTFPVVFGVRVRF